MSGENRVKLSERIYERAKALWPRYLTHPFVTEMADGTLPREKFRYYMVQDYLYLRDYVKIFAAILQKTDDFEQIRFLSGEMANTIDETFRTHLPYMKRLGVTEEEIADAASSELADIRRFLPMHQWGNFNFTNQFLSCYTSFTSRTVYVNRVGQVFTFEEEADT